LVAPQPALPPEVGGGGSVTVTDAEANLVLSAALVAVTVKLPAVLGAVNMPLEMLPPVAVQVTPVLLAPLTEAVNCWLPPVGSEAVLGETEMATATGAGAVTVTEAEADLLTSATLVAVTV
jgi:hypothetical protein